MQAGLKNVALQEQGRGLTFYAGVGGNNNFFYRVRLNAADELGNVQLLGPNAINW